MSTSAPDPIVSLTVNGEPVLRMVPSRLLLSELLRDEIGLTGTHVGCGTGACGSCTVLLDSRPVRSCLMLAVQAGGGSVETIESVGTAERLDPVQEAFRAHHALQCGFCTPGIIMSAVALFRETPHPARDEIMSMLEGHLCRCTGYRGMVEALTAVAARADLVTDPADAAAR